MAQMNLFQRIKHRSWPPLLTSLPLIALCVIDAKSNTRTSEVWFLPITIYIMLAFFMCAWWPRAFEDLLGYGEDEFDMRSASYGQWIWYIICLLITIAFPASHILGG